MIWTYTLADSPLALMRELMTAKRPTFRQILASTLAALLGVQSERNRHRDFSSGRLLPYVIVGGVLVLVFVGSLLMVVNWVLAR
jgi:hypothetical protein